MRVFLAAQLGQDVVVGQVLAKGLPVDGNDAGAGHDPHPFGGTTRDDLDNTDGIAHQLELDSDAEERAFQFAAKTVDVFGGNIDAVWIEVVEQVGYGHFDERIGADFVNVLVLDKLKDGVQFFLRGREPVAVGQKIAEPHAAHGKRGPNQGEPYFQS